MRLDPLLPLSRLRAGGQLTEIRTVDLRLTQAETATFLNDLMHLNLAPSDIALLEARTEGWMAGLQLAALSLAGLFSLVLWRGSRGGNRTSIPDDAARVVGQQSESHQLRPAYICGLLAGNYSGGHRFRIGSPSGYSRAWFAPKRPNRHSCHRSEWHSGAGLWLVLLEAGFGECNGRSFFSGHHSPCDLAIVLGTGIDGREIIVRSVPAVNSPNCAPQICALTQMRRPHFSAPLQG